MTTSKRTLQYRGCKLIGPEEHPGEERYSWIQAIPASRKTMTVLIEKVPGHAKEYDTQSPLVHLFFRDQSLCIWFTSPRWMRGYKIEDAGDGVLNPYLNKVLDDSPFIKIPTSLLTQRAYEVSSNTTHHGDFLLLTGKKKGSPSHLIIVNLSALGLFQGFDEIHMDGSFIFGGEIIGKLDTARMMNVTPLFAYDFVGRDEYGFTIRKQKRMYQAAMQLMRKVERGSNSPLILGFESISFSVNNDRATTSQEDGVAQARKLFDRLFNI